MFSDRLILKEKLEFQFLMHHLLIFNVHNLKKYCEILTMGPIGQQATGCNFSYNKTNGNRNNT